MLKKVLQRPLRSTHSLVLNKTEEVIESSIVAGSKIWYDAQDSSNLKVVGNSVEELYDKSGNGITANQTLGSSQPSYSGNINGNNAINFDQSQFLQTPSGFYAQTIFMVFKTFQNFNAASSFQMPFAGRSTSSNYVALGATSSFVTNEVVTYVSGFHRTATNLNFAPYNANLPAGNYILAFKDNSPTEIGIYLNGLSNLSNLQARDKEVMGSNEGLILCARNTSGQNAFNCDMGEFVCYDRKLSDQEFSDNFQYLSNKWGIAITT